MTTNKLPDGSTWKSFKLTNVTENQTVTFTFSPDTNGDGIPDKYNIYTVTSVAEGQGSVDPSKKSVALGENVVFTVTPGEGQALYQIKIGDEVKLTNTAETPFGGTYTLENVTADTQVTFIFAVDTDGDGIPDASETWYTVTVTHDDNIQMPVGAPEDGIYKVKAGNDITIGFEPVEGFAIDTVDVDGTDYVNNGQTEAPYSSWNEVKFEAVEANHTVHITAAETSDDTGIADKYKFTVQGIILGDPGGQQITLPPILVVYGQDATVDITQYLPEGYTVESIEVGEDTYVNDPNYGKTIAEDESAIADAASDPEATEILVAAPISQAAEIQFNHGVTFDGGNNQITKTEPGKVYTFTADSTVENVDIVSTADNTEWQSSYGIQFYTGEHTLKNATLSGGNAGVIVNSATLNLEGTIDVSGNTFGGIEVCKSSAGTQTRAAMPAGVLNINSATIKNDTEEYLKPTIWIDGNTEEDGVVNGADAFTVVEVPHGDGTQKHFYLDAANAKPFKANGTGYDTLAEAIASGSQVTVDMHKDVSGSVTVPAGSSVTIYGHSHKIAGTITCGQGDAGDKGSVEIHDVVFDGESTASWAIMSQDQTSDAGKDSFAVKLVDCTIQNYAKKGIYVTEVDNLELDGCTFEHCATDEMNDPNTYGDYVVDCNLMGVQDVHVTVKNCTFENNGAKKAAIKVTARGGESDEGAGDVPAGITTSVTSFDVSGSAFNDTVEGCVGVQIGTNNKSADTNPDAQNTTGDFGSVVIHDNVTAVKVKTAYNGEEYTVNVGQTFTKVNDGEPVIE